MPGKRIGSMIALMYFTLVGIMYFMLFSIKKHCGGEGTYMGQETANLGELIAAIITFAGILTVFITQIFFYRKDSQTMSEIKENQVSGNEKLQAQIECKKDALSQDHKELRDIVKEIHLRQEQELELQKNIRDTVPDAGMIKDGIDKICQENAMLRAEVADLKREVERVKEKNKELAKANKNLSRTIESYMEHEDAER